VRQLIRIGYDDLRGFLMSGFEAWEAESRQTSRVPIMPVQELADRLKHGNAPVILDVRTDAEWVAGHLPMATHVELGRLSDDHLRLPQDDLKVIHCGHSDRSIVGISLLEQRGYRNLVLLKGGFSSWIAAGFEILTEK
jgi:hydroxyacylglutathione hydrolase